MNLLRSLLPATLVLAAGLAYGADAPQPSTPQAQAAGPGSGSMMMDRDGMMGGRHMGRGMMGWGGPDGFMCSMMSQHVEGRLAYIKTELKITANQESLWNAYADTARANAKTMGTRCSTMMNRADSSSVSLPDRLDQHERLMAAHLEALQAMTKALKPLYAALSDEQKKTIDEIAWGPMGMM